MAMFVFFLVRKDSIRKQLSLEIGNAITGEFLIRDIGINFFNLFPNVSISLKGVDMRDSAWRAHHESFLKAEPAAKNAAAVREAIARLRGANK